jgi:hypothetical protein
MIKSAQPKSTNSNTCLPPLTSALSLSVSSWMNLLAAFLYLVLSPIFRWPTGPFGIRLFRVSTSPLIARAVLTSHGQLGIFLRT